MFSTSVGRVVRSTCAACSQPTLLTARTSTACLAATSRLKPLSQRSHQRRHSSSKASIPPDGSRRSTPSTQQTSNSSGRVGRRKTKDASSTTAPVESRNQTFAKQYPNLPRVDSTQHLHPSDVNVSSFFSLHRPISVTHAVPPPSTSSSFSSIFSSRQNTTKPQDVIFTLSSVVENLDQQTSSEQDLQWQTVTSDSGTKFDGIVPANIPLDKIVAQFRPFRPPPAPQLFSDDATIAPPQRQTKAPSETKPSTRGRKPKGPRSWSTTIILTEYTNPTDGSKICQVSTTPMTRIPNPPSMLPPSAPSSTPMQEPSQPFLRRMWARRLAWEDFRRSRLEDPPMVEVDVQHIGEPLGGLGMEAISVKRQRKLKMKKHKYKKLMRRTRNLRRKLGKI